MPSLLELALALSPRSRPYLALLVLLSFILLFENTVPEIKIANRRFQVPSLLPAQTRIHSNSNIDPWKSAPNPELDERVSRLYERLRKVCPGVGEPVYPHVELMRAQQGRYAHLKNPRVWRHQTTSSSGHGYCRDGEEFDSHKNTTSVFGPSPESTSPHLYSEAQTEAFTSRDAITPKYMFTTNIRQIASQLPDLLNTLLALTLFLGPAHVTFSILEGPSDDCTPDVLELVLKPMLLELGVPPEEIRLTTREGKIDWGDRNRIEVLADLRNRALKPLWDTSTLSRVKRSSDNDLSNSDNDIIRKSDTDSGSNGGEMQAEEERSTGIGTTAHREDIAAIVFFNDVYLRAFDVLELLHQHVKAGEESGLETGITTGMDWYDKDPDYYYDIWVGRTIDTGDLFYPIPNTYWQPFTSLFPSSPASLSAYQSLQPFQAYSSWNGMAILSPTPFLPPHNVRFRRGDVEKGECSASECTLLAADYWKAGWGRVQVVPSVQLTYEHHKSLRTASDLLTQQHSLGWKHGVPHPLLDTTVQWVSEPPRKVRCHPWPEGGGLGGNVWEKVEWVDPWFPYP